jgi:hypothetical protein
MKIRGIKNLEIEDRGNGKYNIIVDYTKEFEDIVKTALEKKRVTKKDILMFITDAIKLIKNA